MSDPLQALLAAGALKNSLFPVPSRYNGTDTGLLQAADGTEIVYLRRRFVPPADNFVLLQEHVVTQGERLDNIAAQFLGDPTLFWRLCDANNAIRPEELTDLVGRSLGITLPEGIPGPTP
jgi:hypothetical protein